MKVGTKSIECKKWHLILMLILLCITLGISAYSINSHSKQSIRQDKNNELRSISELKSKQILLWKSKLGEGSTFTLRLPKSKSAAEKFISTNWF
ncbi:MAG: hypothetical protein WB779_01070 [Ignavibacteriaceae bacterium]